MDMSKEGSYLRPQKIFFLFHNYRQKYIPASKLALENGHCILHLLCANTIEGTEDAALNTTEQVSLQKVSTLMMPGEKYQYTNIKPISGHVKFLGE